MSTKREDGNFATTRSMVLRGTGALLLLSWIAVGPALADAQTDFFENRIRPVLVQQCYQCHSAKAQQEGKLQGRLLLDTRAGIRAGGESGPAVVPGKLKESLLIEAIRHDSLEMPPKSKLPEDVIADFETWIEMGAPDPRDGRVIGVREEIDIDAGRKFWSFRPLASPAVPRVENDDWPTSDIDRFVLAKLEEERLPPLGDAEPRELVRRLSFDLIGLPPTPARVDEFVAAAEKDRRGAIEDLADELLASPHFGERWGRHWLDVARYGESNGAPKKNGIWPAAWRYRDYVIRSFNDDKPYDQFVREQIAGDLLPHDGDEQRIEQVTATAFLALGMKPDNGTRMDTIAEQLDVTGRAMLGIAIGCARCHDHKFDPLSTADFHAMGGILHNTAVRDGDTFLPLQPEMSKTNRLRKERQQVLVETPRAVSTSISRLSEELTAVGIRRQPDESWHEALERYPNAAKRAKLLQVADQLATAQQQLERIHAQYEAGPYETMAALDRPGGKRGTWANLRIRVRGSEDNLGDEVPRGIMRVLYHGSPPEIPENASGRLQLAHVIERHPLMARVMVNRIWHHLFGRGLVRTVDDFGAMGEPPTHPELLEWLAGEFVRDGHSVKRTIRSIVTSRTYQLTSATPTHGEYAAKDSDNALLWRHSPRRLDAEAIRDAILSVSGRLVSRPPDYFENELHTLQMTDTAWMDRLDFRAVYLPVHRGQTTDILSVFNVPPSTLVIGRRETPSVPTQALSMMNSPLVIRHADRTALRLLERAPADDERIELAYRLYFGRPPTPAEQAEALAFVAHDMGDEAGDLAIRRGWSLLCQALICSAEFRFVR